MSAAHEDRTARLLLVLGTGVGIALAAVGIVRSGSSELSIPADAIAVVNGRPLSREAFARFVAAVAAERKLLTLGAAEQQRLLERMIDEELLLQRGIELGLSRFEPTARRAIVSALIASLTADAEVEEPDEAALRRFYAEHLGSFTRSERLGLDVAFVAVRERPDPLARRIAGEIVRRLRAGEDFEYVRAEHADTPVAELPGGALPIDTVRRYLGPTAARTALGLEVEEISEPVRGSAGYHVLRLRERIAGEVAPFEEVRESVRVELLRRRGEDALGDYLEALRESAEVRLLESEPAS